MKPKYVDREELKIGTDGTWYADGVEIDHEPTLKLFKKSLVRRNDEFWIEIGRESKKIVVEDTGFFVEALRGDHKNGFEIYVSNDRWEKLNPNTLEFKTNRLTCRFAAGEETAKFARGPYYEILSKAEERDGKTYLKIGSEEFTLVS